MKLFLTSANVNENLQQEFFKLVGKNPAEVKFALIENAADPYPEEKKEFVYETRAVLEASPMQIERIDLREFGPGKKNIYEKLKHFDVVWIGGGNTFYLRWILRESTLDTLLPKLLEEGIVYAGGSAGSVIVCPSLEKYDVVDDPTKAPELLKDGLCLIDLQIVPHWGYEKYQAKLQVIKDYYDNLNKKVVTLTDNQAFVLSNDELKII